MAPGPTTEPPSDGAAPPPHKRRRTGAVFQRERRADPALPPPLPSAAALEMASIEHYDARLESYLAKFTDLYQKEILEIQSEDFQERSIPVLKDVLETSMKFWSQFDVEM
eukprot:EG_transcript_30056